MQLNAQTLAALAAALQNVNFPKPAKSKVKPRGTNGGKVKLSKEEFEVKLIEACEKAGYGKSEPRFNILTYDKWVEKGRKVKKGEHGIKVAGRKTRLFHEAQTEAIVQA